MNTLLVYGNLVADLFLLKNVLRCILEIVTIYLKLLSSILCYITHLYSYHHTPYHHTLLYRATIIQHQSSNMGHASMESVAMPGVIRNSEHDPPAYHQLSMGHAQYGSVQSSSNIQHVPPVSSRVSSANVTLSQVG